MIRVIPQLFMTLDPARAESDESLTQAATCAYAIDKMVGNTGPGTGGDSAKAMSSSRSQNGKVCIALLCPRYSPLP